MAENARVEESAWPRSRAGEVIRSNPDLTAQLEALDSGEISAVELLRDSLDLADSVGLAAGAFLERFDESARADAARADADRADADRADADRADEVRAGLGFDSDSSSRPGSEPGSRSVLGGVPLGIKAMIAVAETPTTAQSRVFDPLFHAGRDSTVVERLRAAGAVIAGTTTMAEHAAGRPDPALDFPIPRNPWDLSRWPGGSSCGTAIGISLGLFAGGLGTDTSGSCRIPAAYCGITGMRPARGTVPMSGILNASPTLDIVGPMARSARDCRLLLDVMTGDRPKPSTDCANESRPPVKELRSRKELLSPAKYRRAVKGQTRIGVPRQVIESERIGAAVSTAYSVALADLTGMGFALEHVDLPIIDELIATTMTIMVREMYEVHKHALRSRWADYGRSFRRLAVIGSIISDEAYARALEAATELGSRLDETFGIVDALVMPTWPEAAPPYVFEGGTPQDEWNLTAAFSAVPHPSLALPMGFDEAGLPLSLQVVGPWEEADPGRGNSVVLEIGETFQAATDHHLNFPAIDPTAAAGSIADPDGAIAGAGPSRTATEEATIEQLPEPLRRLGISFTPADIATLRSLARLIGHQG